MARFRFSFWLDSEKDDELLLMDQIDSLKRDRSFTATIRDGIRLICDLRAGKFDVLFELFPDARKQLKDPDTGGNGDDLKVIRQQLARLEQATLVQSNPAGLVMTGSKTVLSGLKPLVTPVINSPSFEDDTDLLSIRRDKSTASAENFLKSAFALQK